MSTTGISKVDHGRGRLRPQGGVCARSVTGWALIVALTLIVVTAGAGEDMVYDPDRTQGGMDLWVCRVNPDGGFEPPVNLGPNVNTRHDEKSPMVSWDGQELFFSGSGRQDGIGGDDLFVCAWQGDGWGPARNLGAPVNTFTDEMGPCLLPDGVTLLYSRYDARQDAFDLVLTVRVDGEWLDPIRFPEPVHTAGEERLASITADGKQLVYTTSRRDGLGGYDLYTSHRDDAGVWSAPENLGAPVNSASSDYSAGISPDGRRLFFSSQRDEPGNFDLYMSEINDQGGWGVPVRLPAPVNTRATEYCPSVGPDGSLYFSSDRRRGRIRVTPIEE